MIPKETDLLSLVDKQPVKLKHARAGRTVVVKADHVSHIRIRAHVTTDAAVTGHRDGLATLCSST